jgi:hypothetical protein
LGSGGGVLSLGSGGGVSLGGGSGVSLGGGNGAASLATVVPVVLVGCSGNGLLIGSDPGSGGGGGGSEYRKEGIM